MRKLIVRFTDEIVGAFLAITTALVLFTLSMIEEQIAFTEALFLSGVITIIIFIVIKLGKLVNKPD